MLAGLQVVDVVEILIFELNVHDAPDVPDVHVPSCRSISS